MKRKLSLILMIVLVIGSVFVAPISSQAATKKPKLNIKRLNLTINTTFNLRVYNVTKKMKVIYSSSDSEIVKITPKSSKKKALLSAVSVGSCTVNVRIKKGKKTVRKLKCEVTVTPIPISIKFAKRQVMISVGKRFRTETLIKPNTSDEQPLYDTTDSSIATVNSRGVITAIAPGVVTIRATLLSTGQTATCTVTVTEADTSTPPSFRPERKWNSEVEL